MPRIRSLKPEFCSSVSIAALTVPCRLHFAMIWTYADDEGRGADNALLIKAAIWPLDEWVGAAQVEEWQAELEQKGRMVRYEVDGRRYFSIVNFPEHQRPNKPVPSKLPPPPDGDGGGLPEPSRSPSGGDTGGVVSHVEKPQVRPLPNGSRSATGELLPVVVEEGRVGVEEQEQERPRNGSGGSPPAPKLTRKERTARFHEAVELLLHRLGKPGIAATKTNPDSWLDSARRGLRAEHHQQGHALLVESPALTAAELALALLPPAPAAVARPEAPADACGLCGGTGLIAGDDGEYDQCDHHRPDLKVVRDEAS